MRLFMLIGWLVTELILLNGNSAVAGSEYYHWQDVQGAWHFSDQPPIAPVTGTNISKAMGQTVNTSKPPSRSVDHVPIKLKDQPINKQQNSQNAREIKQKSKQKQICNALRSKLDTIQAKLRAGYKEPKGNQLRERRRKINNKIYHQC